MAVTYREYPKPIPIRLMTPKGLIVGHAIGVRETENLLRKNSTFDFLVEHQDGQEYFWQGYVLPET